MGSLSKFIKQMSGKPLTTAWTRAYEKGKLSDKSDHGDGAYHPSALSGCPAMLFLMLERFPIPVEKQDGQQYRILHNGNSFHERMQVDLARAGVLRTDRFDATMEIPIYNKKYNIRGHTDGIVNFGARKKIGKGKLFGKRIPLYQFLDDTQDMVLELKSIKGDDDKPQSRQYGFNAVRRAGRPKEEHIEQANIYCKELNLDKMLFLYENKNTHEWLEFIEPFDPAMYQRTIDKILLIESWRAEFKRTGVIPKGVYKAASITGQDRKPWGIYAIDLLRKRLGEPSLEKQRERMLKKVS